MGFEKMPVRQKYRPNLSLEESLENLNQSLKRLVISSANLAEPTIQKLADTADHIDKGFQSLMSVKKILNFPKEKPISANLVALGLGTGLGVYLRTKPRRIDQTSNFSPAKGSAKNLAFNKNVNGLSSVVFALLPTLLSSVIGSLLNQSSGKNKERKKEKAKSSSKNGDDRQDRNSEVLYH